MDANQTAEAERVRIENQRRGIVGPQAADAERARLESQRNQRSEYDPL